MGGMAVSDFWLSVQPDGSLWRGSHMAVGPPPSVHRRRAAANPAVPPAGRLHSR